jgi:hypothetical protein
LFAHVLRQGRDFDEAEAERIIPEGPSISKVRETAVPDYLLNKMLEKIIHNLRIIHLQIVEDYEKFDPYLSSDIHKEYIKIMSSCPPGKEVCTFCYFEKDNKTPRSQLHVSFSGKRNVVLYILFHALLV